MRKSRENSRAVDDLRFRREADVLGAQVAVAFDDAPGARPLAERGGALGEQRGKPRARGLVELRGQCVRGLGKRLSVVGNARGEPLDVGLGRHRDRRALAVEAAEPDDRRAQAILRHRTYADQLVEHALRGQASHLDEPVDDRASAPTSQPAGEVDR